MGPLISGKYRLAKYIPFGQKSRHSQLYPPWKKRLAPENRWLQNEFLLGAEGELLVLGTVVVSATDDFQFLTSETGWWLPRFILYIVNACEV